MILDKMTNDTNGNNVYSLIFLIIDNLNARILNNTCSHNVNMRIPSLYLTNNFPYSITSNCFKLMTPHCCKITCFILNTSIYRMKYFSSGGNEKSRVTLAYCCTSSNFNMISISLSDLSHYSSTSFNRYFNFYQRLYFFTGQKS